VDFKLVFIDVAWLIIIHSTSTLIHVLILVIDYSLYYIFKIAYLCSAVFVKITHANTSALIRVNLKTGVRQALNTISY